MKAGARRARRPQSAMVCGRAASSVDPATTIGDVCCVMEGRRGAGRCDWKYLELELSDAEQTRSCFEISVQYIVGSSMLAAVAAGSKKLHLRPMRATPMVGGR